MKILLDCGGNDRRHCFSQPSSDVLTFCDVFDGFHRRRLSVKQVLAASDDVFEESYYVRGCVVDDSVVCCVVDRLAAGMTFRRRRDLRMMYFGFLIVNVTRCS